MSTKLTRPVALTPDRQLAIIEALAAGNYLVTACDAAGITYSGFHHWKLRCESGDPDAQQYADFFDAVKRAVATGELSALAGVRAGEAGWQGNAWFLERRFPKRWGKKDSVTVNVNPDKIKTMTDEELEAVARGKRPG